MTATLSATKRPSTNMVTILADGTRYRRKIKPEDDVLDEVSRRSPRKLIAERIRSQGYTGYLCLFIVFAAASMPYHSESHQAQSRRSSALPLEDTFLILHS
ncbi:hypothetical protein LY76DRAFT_641561 [Colletotrichum caudatum]|nr:hypothetical protein LY76DRAFT_641561 [Colletotrichum caudatum]